MMDWPTLSVFESTVKRVSLVTLGEQVTCGGFEVAISLGNPLRESNMTQSPGASKVYLSKLFPFGPLL